MSAVVPLRNLARSNPETLAENTEDDRVFRYIDIGIAGRGRLIDEPQTVTFRAAPSRARRVLRPGDTILSTVRTYLRAAWTVPKDTHDLVASTGFICLRPNADVDPRFLGWLAQSDVVVEEIVARSVGVSYPAISPGEVRSIKVPRPPLRRQAVIADYLDRETARIDALIAAKRRMVELLDERRESSAADLVDTANALGSAVPLWTVMRPEETTDAPDLEVLSVYRDHGVIPKSSRSDNYNKTPADLSRYQVVWPGDVVVNKMKAWQGSIGVSKFHGIVSPDYLVCRMLRPIDPSFLHHVLRSPQLRVEFQARSEGIRPAQWRLQWDQMRLIELPLPDEDTQMAVVAAHAKESVRLQKLTSALLLQAELLQERRQALVTAAISGQLELPEAA